MNQIERFAQLQRQDREQTLIFERMNEAAAPAYASVIKSTLTAPTEKMIQEYNAKNQQIPLVINDPDTGEPTKFKFHPVEIEPELEAEEPDTDQQQAIYEAREYQKFIDEELPKVQKERQRINNQHIEVRALYDNGGITEREYNDDTDAINASVAQLDQLIQQYETEIPIVNAEILQNLTEVKKNFRDEDGHVKVHPKNMVLSMGKKANSFAAFPEHHKDPYDYAKIVNRKELEDHWSKLQDKPFSQKVRL